MNDYSIIPKPVNLQPQAGYFEIRPDTIIYADEPNQENAAYLRNFLALPMGYSLPVQPASHPKENTITLKTDPALANLGEEGYALKIEPHAVELSAPGPTGIFYGIQTLRQLLPVESEQRQPVADTFWRIPCCQIRDYPRFAWRGYMLDEGRHFHGKETVLRSLDLMALQKFNVFHWHLTEDQGWRIEIKRYPRLTELSAQRPGTAQSFNDMRKGNHDGVPHGGFYTQDEIREIVAYAAARQIIVIPEIEIPGHSQAALVAYPELSCTGGPFEMPARFGIFKDIYCAGKETTFEFLQNVLDEIMALFPARIIHIGGDEAPKARWQACPACQRRIREEGLKDEHELQIYFVNRIRAYLESNSWQVMGWNEVLDAFSSTTKAQRHEDVQSFSGSLSSFVASKLHGENVKGTSRPIIQYWVRNKKGLLTALRSGQPVVNSAYLDTYLDHSYSLTPLSRAYRFEPVFKALSGGAVENILGLEAPMWTEWVPNCARLDYQTYPRLTAFAEVGWTPATHKDYADFRVRLASFNQRLDILDVKYAPESDWEPPWYRRLFGIFTIAQAQTGVRDA